MNALAHLTSLLFVPMHIERYFDKAIDSAADAIILDLEDAVPPLLKARARDALPAVAARCRGAGKMLSVRVNANDVADLEQCCAIAPDAVFLPKVERPSSVTDALEILENGVSAPSIVPMIESARGVISASAIAGASDAVAALMFGAGDFIADTGFALSWDALCGPAMMVALAAISRDRLAWGLAGSIAILDDMDALEQLARRSRDIGFVASPVIHPKQLAAVDRGFAPTPAEIESAHGVVTIYENGTGGAAQIDGVFIERPIYLRSKALLARAKTPTVSPGRT